MSAFSLKTRFLWTSVLLFSIVAAVIAVRLSFTVMPGLQIDIDFSRHQAIAAAEAFQQEYFPALKTTRTAVTFVTDQHLQNYVELEAGGVAEFQKLVPNVDATTHYWKLRNFAEDQQEELILALSPRGEFISYAFLIPDETPGVALEENAARELAEAGARQHLGERFDQYIALETSVKRQATGRADYTFTYEHTTLKAGEARFRIALTMAGDQLVTVDTFKHIPEAFDQRFGEMRALNNQISQIAGFFVAGLLGLGGLVGGGIWLYRRHELRWRSAWLPAAVVALGVGAATISNLPSAWMGYSTTETATNFLLQQVFQAVAGVVSFGLFLSLVYAVAEGLSRMAFVGHPKLYHAFRTSVVSSPTMLGRVLGSYAWTGLFLCYAMLFIFISAQYLGWWSPANIHTDPNILASWRPALAPIFTALQAGTWEECLFRAIPLALAVIIGRRFNILKPLVIITLILQALIFAGAHANYPQLPGYSRLIELFIPAIVFGVVYLRYGLIPCMLTHFLYDLVLMSLPLFVADDPSLWLDRSLVIAVGVAPLIVLLVARWRQGAWLPLAEQWRNGIPAAHLRSPIPVQGQPVPALEQDDGAAPLNAEQTLPRSIMPRPHWLLLIALLSVVAFAVNFFKPNQIEWPRFEIDRTQAIARAESELASRGVVLEGEWHRTVTTHTDIASAHHFVWHESGREVYQHLIGQYLDTPFWVVTWRHFDGPVEERSEYWAAWLYPDGRLHELVHNLPEGTAGAHLNREQALMVAREWMLALGWPDPQTLEEKAVEEIKRPARADWRIQYIDRSTYDHNNAQALITIYIAGDEVTSYVRGVDVPQDWLRDQEALNASKTPFRIASGVATFILFVVAMCGFLGKHSGRRFRFAIALPWIAVNSTAAVLVALLWIDPGLQQLNTTMSWAMQLGMMLFGIGLNAAVFGLISFLVVQVVYIEPPRPESRPLSDFLVGACLAIGLGGLLAVQQLLLPTTGAPTPYVGNYVTVLPWLTTIASGLAGVMGLLLTLLLALGLLRFCKTRWRLLWVLALACAWLVSKVLAGYEIPLDIVVQLIALAKIGLIVALVQRRQLGVAMALAFFAIALQQLGIGHALYPMSWLHGLVSAIVMATLGYIFVRHWHQHTGATF